MSAIGSLTVRGARGSMPVSGPSPSRYGGRTTCFSADVGGGELLVFDCGTGLTLADDLQPVAPTLFHVFLTHYHLDHVIGLPMYRPLFMPGNTFVFHGPAPEGRTVEEAIAAPFAGTLFPVSLTDAAAEKHFVTVGDDPVDIGPLTITPFPLRHPQGATGYRLDSGTRSVVIATDHEAGDPKIDSGLIEVAGGADVLIHDAQYTPDEYEASRIGWGHSTWSQAVDIAVAAGVRRLVLTSHDPFRSDGGVDAIVNDASSRFGDVVAAYEGMTIPLG